MKKSTKTTKIKSTRIRGKQRPTKVHVHEVSLQH